MLLALQLLNLLETAGSDTTPDAFSFATQTGVPTTTTRTSDPATITGIDAAADITVSNGTYSVNGGAYTALAGTVVNLDVIRLRHTSSGSDDTSVVTTATVGGVSATFTSVTAQAAGVGSMISYIRKGRR